MAIEFLVYADGSSGFNKFPIYTSWMGTFLDYVTLQSINDNNKK
jgi:hypothetical protein